MLFNMLFPENEYKCRLKLKKYYKYIMVNIFVWIFQSTCSSYDYNYCIANKENKVPRMVIKQFFLLLKLQNQITN